MEEEKAMTEALEEQAFQEWFKKDCEHGAKNLADYEMKLKADIEYATAEKAALEQAKSNPHPCTHPNHVDGESCFDRAVGCHPDCRCCHPILPIPEEKG
jgi:hypothetical protein